MDWVRSPSARRSRPWSGLQGALWALGRCPEIVRPDNLSAATHEFRRRWPGLPSVSGMCSSTTACARRASGPGESHENGVAEKANDWSRGVAQALVMRGSRDFDNLDEYQVFRRRSDQRHFTRLAEKLTWSASSCARCRLRPCRATRPTTRRCVAGAPPCLRASLFGSLPPDRP